jgi:hypothetical protein
MRSRLLLLLALACKGWSRPPQLLHRGRRVVIRRTLAVIVIGVVVALAAATGATGAGQALHQSFPISGDDVFPAGTACDFNEEDSFTGTLTFTAAPNGTFVQQMSVDVTHTNLDTGYTLTEHDSTTTIIPASGSTVMVAGLFWHLRDPSGKIVLVKAGRGVFDLATGETISFTPNSSLDQSAADVICPALGGAPA